MLTDEEVHEVYNMCAKRSNRMMEIFEGMELAVAESSAAGISEPQMTGLIMNLVNVAYVVKGDDRVPYDDEAKAELVLCVERAIVVGIELGKKIERTTRTT